MRQCSLIFCLLLGFAFETSNQFLAVGGATNGPKGSNDPTQWMPPLEEYHCTYLKKWVEVKHLNDLYFDESDFQKMERAKENAKTALYSGVTTIRDLGAPKELIFPLKSIKVLFSVLNIES